LIKIIFTEIRGNKILGNFGDKSYLKTSLTDFMCSSEMRTCRYETSKPMRSVIHNIGKKNIVSSEIKTENFEFEHKDEEKLLIDKQKFDKINKFYLKKEPEIHKLYTKIKHTISGKSSLQEFGDKKILTSLTPEDQSFLKSYDPDNTITLPIHAVNENEQILIGNLNDIINPADLAQIHFNLAANVILCYGKPFWLGSLDEGGNYVFEKQDYLTREVIQENHHFYNYFFGSGALNLEKFYKNYSELYKPENANQLINYINNALPNSLSPSDLNDLINQACKEKGISLKDAIQNGVFFELLSGIFKL
jgi:hypothetical protein